MIEELASILKEVVTLSGKDFSGVGVLVWDDHFELPVFPLRVNVKIPKNEALAKNLAEISSLKSDLHDGFHLLTPALKITAVAQYFSPPVVPGIHLNRERKFGGRYLAALFGSVLPGVLISAIATSTSGIVIFENGIEVYFEEV